MVREKSAGVIVFRWHPKEGLQYLLLYHRGNYWNFPKGGVEPGESESETALRELAEETSLKNVKLIDGWRQQTQFFFKVTRDGRSELIKKDLVLFLAKATPDVSVITSDKESKYETVNGYAWLDSKSASKFLRFKNLKSILAEADSFVNSRINEYRKSLKNN